MPRAMGGGIVWSKDNRIAWVIPAWGEVCLGAVAKGGGWIIPSNVRSAAFST